MRNRVCMMLLAIYALMAFPAYAQSTPQSIIQKAIDQTNKLPIYRITTVINGSGAFVPGGTTATREQQVRSTTTTVNRRNIAYTFQSADQARRGFDAQQGTEGVLINGEAYARGPLPLSGTAESRWYRFAGAPSGAVAPYTLIAGTLQEMLTGISLNTLRSGSAQVIDRRSCSGYRGDQTQVGPLVERLLGTVGGVTLPVVAGTTSPLVIDRATYVVYVCNDSIIRGFDLIASGSIKERTTRRYSLRMTIRITDVNNSRLAITVPTDAISLKINEGVPGRATSAGDLRVAPEVQSQIIAKLAQREQVALLNRTANSRWYRVRAADGVGWVPATQLTIAPASARAVPEVGALPATSSASGTPTAVVTPGPSPTPAATATPSP
jgi:Bacterial SH3 domain